MIKRCARCGNWVRQEVEARSFHPVWGDIVQHQRCKEVFRGTNVHYLHAPEPDFAGEVFTTQNDDGTHSLFRVEAIIRELCIGQNRPIINATIPLHVSAEVIRKNEVNEDDAMAIAEARMAEGTLFDPIIVLQRPDGGNFPIDGSHRIAVAHYCGREDIAAWVVHLHETDPYRIDGWHPDLSAAFAVQR